MVRRILTAMAIMSCILAIPGSVAGEDGNDIVIGKSATFYSAALNEERTILIACPENYAETEYRYPVLYTLDAEKYFNYAASLTRFLAANGRIPQMIVIGIPNTDRSRDFSYSLDEIDSLMGADHFLLFLKDELIPYIDQEYRTTSYRIINGWCATGIFCIYSLFTRPDLFDAYIASSPYLVKEAGFIFNLVEEYPEYGLKSHKFLFMSVGDQDRPDLKAAVPEFAGLLEKRSLSNLEWHFKIIEKENHYTIEPKTFYSGLEELYSGLIHLQKIAEGGIDSARDKVKALAAEYGLGGYLPEDMLTEMGYHLLNQEYFSDAITIFKLIAEAYPNSWNAYDNLGEAYMMNGDRELAIRYYRKSLEMNPQNDNAVQMLEKLENE